MSRRVVRTLVPFGLLCTSWYHLYRFDDEKYKLQAYNKGRDLTMKYGHYSGWNSVLEPFIIRQFGLLFGIGNAFLRGLVSDNGDDAATAEAITALEASVESDLKCLERAPQSAVGDKT